MTKKSYKANGKLLLTAEYLVLDQAKAIALPTKLGQTLAVETRKDNLITWQSFLPKTVLWNSAEFVFKNQQLQLIGEKDDFSLQLEKILKTVAELRPTLFRENGYDFTTHLEFDKNWGLGSSSTFIYNLAAWAKINPYLLLQKTFGGSGYDIACAGSTQPILYQRNGIEPKVEAVNFNPDFSDHLFFVYLNKKKNSREAIQHYRQFSSVEKQKAITKINRISEQILNPDLRLEKFEKLMVEHEAILSKVLQLPTIKELLFKDYSKAIKSLGAWGGDFILATGNQDHQNYFKEKGYLTVIPYRDFVFI